MSGPPPENRPAARPGLELRGRQGQLLVDANDEPAAAAQAGREALKGVARGLVAEISEGQVAAENEVELLLRRFGKQVLSPQFDVGTKVLAQAEKRAAALERMLEPSRWQGIDAARPIARGARALEQPRVDVGAEDT